MQVIEFTRQRILARFGFFIWFSRIGRPFISRELPDVAGHIVETVSVGSVFADFGSCSEAACGKIGARTVGRCITPREEAIQAATRGMFPFSFCGQALALPFAISDGVVPSDVRDRMIFQLFGNVAVDPVPKILAIVVSLARIFFRERLIEAREFFFRVFFRETPGESEELRVGDGKSVEVEGLKLNRMLGDFVDEKSRMADFENRLEMCDLGRIDAEGYSATGNENHVRGRSPVFLSRGTQAEQEKCGGVKQELKTRRNFSHKHT